MRCRHTAQNFAVDQVQGHINKLALQLSELLPSRILREAGILLVQAVDQALGHPISLIPQDCDVLCMTMFVYILLITLTLTLQQSEMMINDVEIVNLVRESIDNALAPTIISLTERQNTIETSTNKQLDNLKSLLDDIQNLISRKSGKHGVPETLPALLSCQLCGKTFHELDSLDSKIYYCRPVRLCLWETFHNKPSGNIFHNKHCRKPFQT